MTLEAVNRMEFSEFIVYFQNVIPNGTIAASTVWASRPFLSLQDLHRAFDQFIDKLPLQLKEGLIRCYPALDKQLMGSGHISHRLLMNNFEMAQLRALIDCYERKFGFPFVLDPHTFNDIRGVLSSIHARLKNCHVDEIQTALLEISKIVCYFLMLLVHN